MLEPSRTTTRAGLDDVVDICRDLIRIDTSNYASPDGPGERLAAEYVAAKLADVGIESRIYEAEKRRSNLVATLSGRSRPGLLVHGHLDVVPAEKHLWTVDPFAGEIIDDYLWGRGSIDMKHMVAMILAAVREMKRNGVIPERDLVLAFLADEENDTSLGSRWMVQNHRELFDGCTEAISEVGGYSVQIAPERRIYMIESGRKGVAWMRLTAKGKAAHGSITNTQSALGALSGAISRIADHEWPLLLTPASAQMVSSLQELTAIDLRERPALESSVLAPVAGLLTSSLRHVSNPTIFRAGASPNVVPGHAEATVDGRYVFGHQQAFLEEIAALAGPDISVDLIDLTSGDESDPRSDLVGQMQEALLSEDAGASVVPYNSSASTDNASFAEMGIQGYGFAPLKLPTDYSFSSMFHGVDERVPVEALKFGARVLYRFLCGADPAKPL
ncbi:M20/M25/M40 family metallo-hydrolase [Arthrobacter sp. StoSoilB5]|uniref:M20/M25/M40 family metallo-hydrolase n=1 Tax=Arthrobacter sp. StoSoilB5 TaxID=2830992 RepID=UPI001CC79C8A|nr:M20/M25/M40 family metallo-hydrolase [Arthrobacter sp. StoSoilB5]BCW44736.1 peptidase M20 [Arthrobacter sp. StoSoilB5]